MFAFWLDNQSKCLSLEAGTYTYLRTRIVKVRRETVWTYDVEIGGLFCKKEDVIKLPSLCSKDYNLRTIHHPKYLPVFHLKYEIQR